MSEEKKPTGKAVRDVKGAAENTPAPAEKKQIQIHAGNLGVVQTQLLSEINTNLSILASCARIWLKENPPKGDK